MFERDRARKARRPKASCTRGSGPAYDDSADVMSLHRCRELLGAEGLGLADDQIDQIRRHADALAHVIIDTFLEHRRTEL